MSKEKADIPAAASLSLAARLCRILGDAEAIEKKGYNSQFNYHFIREADVADGIRKLMAKHGVFCLPTIESIEERDFTTSNQKFMNFVRVKVKYTFINADNPEEKYEICFLGDATDSQDKGIYKALTGCHKYMLLRVFSLGADDDPEKDDHAKPHGPPVRLATPPRMNGVHKPPPVPLSDDMEGPPPFDPSDYGDGPPMDGDAETLYAYSVPFKEKEQWKPILKDHGFQWNAERKVWTGTRAISELARYQVMI